MRITTVHVYHGANLFASVPVARLSIDLGPLASRPRANIDRRLIDAFRHHVPELAWREGDEEGLGDDAEVFALLTARAAIGLQRQEGADVDYAATFRGDAPGLQDAVVEYWHPEVGIAAAKLAFRLARSLLPSAVGAVPPGARRFDFPSQRQKFLELAQFHLAQGFPPSLVRAARRRDIPWSVIDPNFPFSRLGQGRYQRRLADQISDATPYLGQLMSRNKVLTAQMLAEVGFPVPQQTLVSSRQAAVGAARRLGYPVVVKPNRGSHGVGTHAYLLNDGEVADAYDDASGYARRVLVQEFLYGDLYRLLVINGHFAAATLRTPPRVVGDGERTIEELMTEFNQHPRITEPGSFFGPVRYDHDVRRLLGHLGYARSSVPKAGEVVFLKRIPSIRAGGARLDVSERVHPHNRGMVVEACAAFGLETAGIDFITSDIGRPYTEAGGGILEVNCNPTLGFYERVEGSAPDVPALLIESVFPRGSPSRIPFVVTLGGAGAGDAARFLDAILRSAGSQVGLALREAFYVRGEKQVGERKETYRAARAVLNHPAVDSAVLEGSPESVCRDGLGCDACDVLAVVPGGGGASDEAAIRIAASITRKLVVCSADDEACAAIVREVSRASLCLVDPTGGAEALRRHVDGGGPAVSLRPTGCSSAIALYPGSGRNEAVLLPAEFASEPSAEWRPILFAAAAAYGLGIGLEDIARGLLAACRSGADLS